MSTKQLIRSSSDRWVAGIAAGLAGYFNIDPLIMRLVWIILFAATGGTAVIFYFILWFIMPTEDEATTRADYFDPEEIVVEDAE